jgi:hypothetical protein
MAKQDKAETPGDSQIGEVAAAGPDGSKVALRFRKAAKRFVAGYPTSDITVEEVRAREMTQEEVDGLIATEVFEATDDLPKKLPHAPVASG